MKKARRRTAPTTPSPSASMFLLIALAAHEDWEVHHMDVKSAFLNGDLGEEVYLQQAAASRLCGHWQRAQGAQTEEGTIWATPSTSSLE
jgi:hypothetical protein